MTILLKHAIDNSVSVELSDNSFYSLIFSNDTFIRFQRADLFHEDTAQNVCHQFFEIAKFASR